MKATRIAAALAVTLVGTLGFAACTPDDANAGKTTCSQWLQLPLDPSQALQGKGQQYELAKKMLDAHGKDDSALSQAQVVAQITQYCNVDNSGTQPNANQPIDDAVSW